MSETLLLEDVSLRYDGRQYLSEINLTAAPGEIVAICGTSGSHKDALIRLITRMYPSSYTLTGRLFVDHVETERLDENEMRYARMMNIAVLPQNNALDGIHKTVKQYITAPFRDDMKKNAHRILLDTKRIMQLLGVTDAERLLSKRLENLSAKEKRAVLYATALATDPAIAILTVSSLDAADADADAIYNLLIKVCKIKNTTLLFLTSDINFARKYGETVYMMHKDRLWAAEGAAHPYMHYLEKAASFAPFPALSPAEKAYITASKLVPRRGMETLDFTLHGGEIHAVPAKNALTVFSGRRRPWRGSLIFENKTLSKSRSFRKKSLLIRKGMLFPPAKNAASVLRAFGNLKKEDDLSHILSVAGLPADYASMSTRDLSFYETCRLGIAAAVAAGVHTVLLYKPELLTDTADQYDILSMLHEVCEKTGMCALIITDTNRIIQAFSSPSKNENTMVYAN